MSQGWIAVDLDGTLAVYDGWRGEEHIGEPIPAMVERVQHWRDEGRDVRIFTARVSASTRARGGNDWTPDRMRAHIQGWCITHMGVLLPVTCEKDYGMIELWDDRCVRVITNTGEPCCDADRR